MDKITPRNLLSLASFILIIFGIGSLIGSLTSTNIETWFMQLNHPFIAPPNWVFAPVWTILYIMIAISGWLVFISEQLKGKLFTIYAIQLSLNFLWSFIFFCWQEIDLALLEMSILWVFLAWNIRVFTRVNKLAGSLLMPYLLWISFAWLLNFSYIILNQFTIPLSATVMCK